MRRWGRDNGRANIIFEYFSRQSFYELQPLIEDAVEFVREISKRAEVFFITAAYPEAMSIRAKRLIADFPFIPKENIIMGTRKDMVDVDILLDDGAHNIQASKSAYPILMRKPWNRHMTGCLAINTYEEALSLLDMILDSYTMPSDNYQGNRLIALVGPSASGKTEIAKNLIQMGFAMRGVSYTTRERRKGEEDGVDYFFINEDKFTKLRNSRFFFEITSYAGYWYGTSLNEIDKNLAKNNVVMPLDITGAIACKEAFGDKVVLVFVERDQEEVFLSILKRQISDEEKASRILSYPAECKNKEICDYVISNNKKPEQVAKELISMLSLCTKDLKN